MYRKSALLIDGSNLIYRAFYGFPQVTSSDGRPVGALLGFCTMLVSTLRRHQSDYVCVALDSGRSSSFRAQMYKDYKANRPPTPEALKLQFPFFDKACEALGIPVVRRDTFEADDVIATYSDILSANNISTKIISVDKDLTQLINDNVCMFDPVKAKETRAEDVFEKYGVYPEQMVYFQAIVGDAVDNVPGAKGLGPVTAAKLLRKYGDLHRIYEDIQNLKPKWIREKLELNRESVELSLKLVSLDRNVDVDRDINKLRMSYSHKNAVDFMNSFGFKSVINRLYALEQGSFI